MTSVTTDRRYGVNASKAIKVPVKAASTANLTLSGEQTIDGVSCTEDDRVLCKDQTDGTENGIYVVSTGSWSRAPDWDDVYDVTQGTLIPCNGGTTNGVSVWRVTTSGTITPGTTDVAITLSSFGSLGTTSDLVAHTSTATGAGVTDLQERADHVLYITDFSGVDKTGATDSTAGITAAQSYVSGLSQAVLVWPAGIYKYSVSPNWAQANLKMIAQGDVRLRYTGTGNALILDGGAAGGGVYNMHVGPFIIEAPSTADDGCYMRAIHHSHIHINVRGCGTTQAGLRMIWGVANTIYLTVSSNETGSWYSSGQPAYGLYLDERGALEECAYNTFITPILEACDQGIYIDNAIGNTFLAGTSEGNDTKGVHFTNNAQWNKFWGTDFEQNNGLDVTLDGTENELMHTDSFELVSVSSGATKCRIIGGSHDSIAVSTNADLITVADLTYNRFNTPGTLTYGTTSCYVRNVATNVADGTYISAAGLAVRERALAKTDITTDFTTSPTTYTNTSAYNEAILVAQDGEVTRIDFKRGGVAENVVGTTAWSTDGSLFTVSGMYELSPGDGLVVTFASTPTVLRYTR